MAYPIFLMPTKKRWHSIHTVDALQTGLFKPNVVVLFSGKNITEKRRIGKLFVLITFN